MTPPNNPFADDVTTQAGQQLESAGSPLNPYAAPTGTMEPEGAGPGVGIWRHQDYVVLHREADFPNRCIWTNEPATYRWPLDQRESTFRGDGKPANLYYCLSPAARQEWFAGRLRWAAMMGVSLLMAWLMNVLDSQLFTLNGSSSLDFLPWLPAIFLIVAIGAAYRFYRGWHPLRVVYTDGPYLLIAGARLPFLSSLPHWPGLYAQR